MAPQWALAASASRSLAQNVTWAKLDVDAAPEASELFGVEGLPTIVAVRGGHYWPYEGERSAAQLTRWAAGNSWTAARARPLPGNTANSANSANTANSANNADNAVVTLTDANWAATVRDDAVWMVEFYAPWCGHCQKLQPVWAGAAARGGATRWGKVDTDAQPALAERFAVEALPTIVRLAGGRRTTFEGPRTADALLAFAADTKDDKKDDKKKQEKKLAQKAETGAAVDDPSPLLTDSTFDAAVGAGEAALLLFTADWCDYCGELAPHWAAYARAPAGPRAVRIDSDAAPGLIARYNVSGLPTVLLARPGQRVRKHVGERTAAGLRAFAQSGGDTGGVDWLAEPIRTALPGAYDTTLLATLDDADARARLSDGTTWVVAMTADRACPRCAPLLAALHELARSLATRSPPARVAVYSAPRSLQLAAAWGVTELKQLPALWLVAPGAQQRWPLEWETYTADDLLAMVTHGLDPADALPVTWPAQQTEQQTAPPEQRLRDTGSAGGGRRETLMQAALAVLVIAVVGLAVAYYNTHKRLRAQLRARAQPAGGTPAKKPKAQ